MIIVDPYITFGDEFNFSITNAVCLCVPRRQIFDVFSVNFWLRTPLGKKTGKKVPVEHWMGIFRIINYETWRFQWYQNHLYYNLFPCWLKIGHTLLPLHAFFYKHHRYKHRQSEIWPKNKHHPSTSPSLTSISTYNFSTQWFVLFSSHVFHIRQYMILRSS